MRPCGDIDGDMQAQYSVGAISVYECAAFAKEDIPVGKVLESKRMALGSKCFRKLAAHSQSGESGTCLRPSVSGAWPGLWGSSSPS